MIIILFFTFFYQNNAKPDVFGYFIPLHLARSESIIHSLSLEIIMGLGMINGDVLKVKIGNESVKIVFVLC